MGHPVVCDQVRYRGLSGGSQREGSLPEVQVDFLEAMAPGGELGAPRLEALRAVPTVRGS